MDNKTSHNSKSEVRQVLDYIITEVCNEVEIDNPSKTKEVSSPQALITRSGSTKYNRVQM
jgi:hypothetical protein